MARYKLFPETLDLILLRYFAIRPGNFEIASDVITSKYYRYV